MTEIKLSHFTKKFSGSNPLQNNTPFELGPIHYTFSGPAIYGLLGSNGSGKSTLLRSIYEESKQLKTSFCDSLGSFDPEWRVNDILVFSRFTFHQGFPSTKDNLAISGVVELLNLEKILFQSMGTLSTGQIQKVWLASSLVQEPKILLLDEPTSHLDAKQKNSFMKILRNILVNHMAPTKLILLSSHDIHLCLDFCDHIIGLKNGKIVYDRPTQSDTAQEILETVYDD